MFINVPAGALVPNSDKPSADAALTIKCMVSISSILREFWFLDRSYSPAEIFTVGEILLHSEL